MADKLKPVKVGVSLGLTFVIISLLCAILVAVAPELTLKLGSNIFHSLDLSKIYTIFSWSSVIIGLVELFIIGFIGGWIFSVIYNKIK